jgi:hypothetical protein
MDFQSLIESTLYIERCTVFIWEDYTFQDTDEKRNKYWITLNCKINDFPINVILPTSKYGNHHYNNPINLKDCVIINKGESQYFNAEKTILDLKNIVKEEEYTIKEAYENQFLIKLGALEEHLCQRLEQAIEDSELLEQYLIDELLCNKN